MNDDSFGPIEIVSTPCMPPGKFAMVSDGLVYLMGADTIYRFQATLMGPANKERLGENGWESIDG